MPEDNATNVASTTPITVYSTTWCAFCKAAKQYFDGLNIAYKEIDVEEDPAAGQRIVERTGQMGVPVIEIGDQAIVGFDRPKVEAALKSLNLI